MSVSREGKDPRDSTDFGPSQQIRAESEYINYPANNKLRYQPVAPYTDNVVNYAQKKKEFLEGKKGRNEVEFEAPFYRHFSEKTYNEYLNALSEFPVLQRRASQLRQKFPIVAIWIERSNILDRKEDEAAPEAITATEEYAHWKKTAELLLAALQAREREINYKKELSARHVRNIKAKLTRRAHPYQGDHQGQQPVAQRITEFSPFGPDGK